ncbi:MAG: hypothetical protein ACLP50_24125 [Solirubrobacteraceae bacterium]
MSPATTTIPQARSAAIIITSGEHDETPNPALGDYAQGQRTSPDYPSVRGDYATGMRTAAEAAVGDFATGMRAPSSATRTGDFATGLRAEPVGVCVAFATVNRQTSLPMAA